MLKRINKPLANCRQGLDSISPLISMDRMHVGMNVRSNFIRTLQDVSEAVVFHVIVNKNFPTAFDATAVQLYQILVANVGD